MRYGGSVLAVKLRVSWVASAVAASLVVLAGSLAQAGAPTVDAGRVGVPAGNPIEIQGTGTTPGAFEITLSAEEATVDLGGGLLAKAVTFNGTVPGPTIRVKKGQRVIVNFRNNLPDLASGIHWHGIELNNRSDGTGVTQDQVLPGGTFKYDFIPTREGVFWYHPHMSPTNVEFKGQYGMFIVEGPINDGLERDGTIPGRKHTRLLVLSDITVCKAPTENDDFTFPNDPTLPWAGDETDPGPNLGPYLGLNQTRNPDTLCNSPIDDEGNTVPAGQLAEGDVPNIQPKEGCGGPPECKTNEGQLVLTNGVVVAPRAGSPRDPGDVGDGPGIVAVRRGDGWRLQVVNTSVTRYFRLRLTRGNGDQIDLLRIGGQGGILDRPRLEGGVFGSYDTKFFQGEIVVGAGERSDVVFKVPTTGPSNEVLTLWTLDYQRVGGGGPGTESDFPVIPSVPAAHFRVEAGDRTQAREFDLTTSTVLRSGANATESLKTAQLDTLADVPLVLPSQNAGSISPIFVLQAGPQPMIDGVAATGLHHGTNDFQNVPAFDNSRYALLGTLLELQWSNTTAAHHPLHFHGFSIQPVKILDAFDDTITLFTYPYNEFVDTIDVLPGTSVVFRVRFDDRPNPDGSPGGGVGRWVMHCHIFFHAGLGMNAEIQVLPSSEAKPVTSAKAGSAAASRGAPATGSPAHRH